MSALDIKTYTAGHCVSTVKLSVEHSWEHGGGYWYETFIFPASGTEITEWTEEWGDRYRTEDAACIGHLRVVEQVLSGDLP